MNKRLMQFVSDLTDEIDNLKDKLECERCHIHILQDTVTEHKATIAELKKKLRHIKNERNNTKRSH